MDRVARLADIATHANVSEATVSRVLNDRPGVSASTRQSVLASLEVLGIDRPSRLRPKKPGNFGLVGLFMPELNNPIFPAFAQAIESSLAHRGFTPVLCTHTPGGTREDDHIRVLVDRGVAGVIYLSGDHADTTSDPQRYVKLRDRGLAMVLVNGYREGIPAPFISTDDAAAVELSFTHLTQLRHTKIGLAMGPSRYVPVQRKVAAFSKIVSRLPGETNVEYLIEIEMFTLEGGAAAASRLIAKGCTAIICGSDLMALGAVRAARSLGKRVPEDISIIGYDDSTLIAFTDPPLTTIRQPVLQMGEAAVQALIDEIAHIPTSRTEYLFEPELIVRRSTAEAPL